ncbi:hypothetical protein D915_006669 [Fasciola hepatica]|uniref:Uncharacterized protein n=1 Tax=Fasciola hepatica TaxID=6192 RepID=A0A4E0R650_FASHE|nr:hypothetical protein D915_006669 [Fasciola hepatica]
MKLEMALKILSDPTHRFNREMLHSTYGVQLPTLDSSDQMEKAAVESTAKDPVHLSQIEDRSKQMKPKLIRLDHVELGTGGTLDLFQRGYIPSNAVIRFDPPLIRSRKAYLHNAHERSIRPMLSLEDKPLCPVYKAFSESEPLQGQKAEKRLFRNIDPQQKDRKILAKNKAIVSNIAAGDQQKLAITSGQHTTEDSPPSTHEVKSPKQNVSLVDMRVACLHQNFPV